LLNKGKFELRKWVGNSSKLLNDIAAENHGLACVKVLQADEHIKILGINWNPAADVFEFRFLPRFRTQNARFCPPSLNCLIHSVGSTTPVTITAKIFLQNLWQLKVD